MKKLFISVPMRGRTEEKIRKSMQKMHKIAEAVFEQELEVIPTYIEDKPPENVKQAVWYLGRSIQLLAEADYFIGIDYCNFEGCNTERGVAIGYHIPTHLVSLQVVAQDVLKEEHMCNFSYGAVSDSFRGGGGGGV